MGGKRRLADRLIPLFPPPRMLRRSLRRRRGTLLPAPAAGTGRSA